MAAVIWQGMLLAEIALAGAVAWPVNSALDGPLGALLALWLAAMVLLQPLLVLIAFALSGAAARDTHRPLRVRTVVAESAALVIATLAMSIHQPRHVPWQEDTRTPDTSPSPGAKPPVLLIHGILCNGALWNPLVRRLIAAGFGRLEVIELAPPFADIETHAAKVARTLAAMQSGSGGERVVVVAHSMGGLVARAALRAVGPGVIARIITLGTPHHGTAIACRLPFAPTRQMCPDSSWLRRLNAGQEGNLAVPVTSLYSPEDTLIAPARSAELAGARLVRIDGLGHLALANAPRALEQVLAELDPGAPA